MDKTAIQSLQPAPPVEAPYKSPAKKARPHFAYRVLTVLASLRITVALFSLALILVFYGTWAQVDAGIWTVVKEYFRSWFIVWIPLKTVLLRTVDVDRVIPFPGGWMLGGLLLVNLLAAHAIRFRINWKRSGILLIHSGLVLLMLGEFVAGIYQVESRMTIAEGHTSNFTDDDKRGELVFNNRSDPKVDDEIIIPDNILSAGGVISFPDLPVDVEVVKYMRNSDVRRLKDNETSLATAGAGREYIAFEKKETAGVDTQQSSEFAAAYVTLKKKGTGEPLGTYLVSMLFDVMLRPSDNVEINGTPYEMSLRPHRSYRPYSVSLIEFRHDKYVGTDTPKNYSSKVRLVDPEKKEDRIVTISMNNPLRYRGETLYQASLNPLSKGTVLQVVRNPGWTLPYIACLMISLGMLVHFGLHLKGFLERRVAS